MRVPKPCYHRAAKKWYVTLDGHEHYFPGTYPKKTEPPPPAVLDAYDALMAERGPRKESKRPARPRSPTVQDVWFRYFAHAQGYYVKSGRQTSEVHCIRTACRIAARLYGALPVEKFDALKLRAVRDEMVNLGWARRSVNKQVNRVRGMFKWAAAEGMAPLAVYQLLQLLPPLKKGRTAAPERKRVQAVPWAAVEATLPHLPPVLAALVRVHWLLGCRAQDVVRMRKGDLDRTGPLWRYTCQSWKTEHRENEEPLSYWVGPQAQRVLAPLVDACQADTDYVFSTRGRRGHTFRRRGCYSTASYRVAVQRVLKKKNLPRWSPLQIRHARLSEIRKGYTIEGAQAVARHREITVTQIYAQTSEDLARRIMGEVG